MGPIVFFPETSGTELPFYVA